MMRTTSKFVKTLAALSALLPFCTSGLASIVYDNTTTDLNQTPQAVNGVETGDQITLSGTDRTVTDFKFEYFLQAANNGNETAQLRFYANDGPLVTAANNTGSIASPGTLLYTSPVLSLGTGFQTAEASGISINVPDTFTWTVTFQGLSANELAGLRIYDPPTVGSSFSDFWQKNNNSWNTYVFADAPGNFAARVTAVPEASTFAYLLLAGMGWVGFVAYRRRTA